MKLQDYGVYFSSYPWMPFVTPFKTWEDGAPTKSLPWYDAYNAVKHDREGQFERATLECAFEAVAGCLVMLLAQYGHDQQPSLRAKGMHSMNVLNRPVWAPSECYIQVGGRYGDGRLPPFPLAPADYPF
jgi:hypothetical protein